MQSLDQEKSDEEIVGEIIKGNQDLYSKIISKYQDKLFRYANRLVGDYDQSIDIVQNSFIKSYINLQSFDLKKNFSSWIYRIVHNEAMNVIKRNKRQIILPEDFDIKSEEDVEKEFERKEDINNLDKCLKSIPAKYSEVLILFYFEQKSYIEISEIVRIPQGTVATRINRAKTLIKKICQKK